ncbi:MAG: TonB-dependent receptor [Fluviicola sp.]|nr:TonB-dependent receptor [Fluviicola sp.]
MKIIKLFFLLLFFSSKTTAQTNWIMSGTITDSLSGETIIGATVAIKENPIIGTASNDYGFYSLSLLEGSFTIVISAFGYHKEEVSIDFKQDKFLDIQLLPEGKMIGEVEINATRSNDNVTSYEMGVERLDLNQIKKIPVLFGEQDIVKTLQLLPGVKSLGEGNGGLYVRGGDNSQNLILLDEAAVYNVNHLLGFFSTFNSDAIKDVTLYKGTAPSEYGGRISSVLDIKMKEGNNQKFHVGGGIGLIASRLNIEGPIVKDKSSFLISGRRTYADLFLKLSSNDAVKSNKLYFYDLNAKFNYKFNSKNHLYVSGYFGRDVISFADRFGINWGNATGTVRWNHIWGSKLFSNTSLIYSDYDYEVKIMRDVDEFSLNSIIKNWNIKQEFQYFRNDKSTFNFGVNSIYHVITPGQVTTSGDSDIIPIELQDRQALENALYFSNERKIGTRWNMNYGLRLTSFSVLGAGDFYSYTDGEISDTASYKSGEIVKTYVNLEPRFNLSYILNEKSSVKVSYTRNTQNLHLITNSTSSTPTDIWISSSNNVKPEIGDQISAGYFRNFSNDQYQFSTEVYYKAMQNQLDLKNGAEIRANEHIENELLVGKGRAYGLELLLKKKTGKFTGWVGYTLSRTEKQIEGINDGNWYAARQDATHDISLVGIFDITKKWSISATWVFNTGNAVTFPSGKYELNGNVEFYYTERNGYRMPTYHRLDLGATRYLKKSEKFESSLSFSIYNAYGRKNAYTIDFEEDPNDATKTKAVMTYLFTFVPSITYNFKF